LKFENQYIVHFKGLKEGVHDFDFIIEKPFFEEFEHLEVPEGQVKVHLLLTRKTNLLELELSLKGRMMVACDRCLDYFEIPVDFSGQLLVKFSENPQEEDDEVIFLHPDESRLDLKHYLYECLSLSIPFRKIHPDLPNGESGCDPEMIRKLNDLLIED
jgi:uncharacterized metal-binding protein YceD (DUF177 family)